MPRTPPLAVLVALVLVGVAVLACPWQDRAGAESRAGSLSATHPAVEPPLDPKLRFLLKQTDPVEAYGDSPFLTTLSALARERGWDPPNRPEEGRAVAVRDGRTRYVVVVLGGWTASIPGDDWQELLLLDRDGRLLDRLSCRVSSRLTRWWETGVFRTDTPEAPEGDGAQFVIRFVPKQGQAISECWTHDIAHAGKEEVIGRDEGRPGPFRPAEWVRQGLCRVAVRHGKLAVLLPRLEK
jgi:hypothetical protein